MARRRNTGSFHQNQHEGYEGSNQQSWAELLEEGHVCALCVQMLRGVIEHDMNQSTLNALMSFPQQLEYFYEAIPAGYKHWAPLSWDGIPSENFTAIEQICHVRDVELDGYHVRFQRALHEANPTLESLEGYILARKRDYANANAADVFAANVDRKRPMSADHCFNPNVALAWRSRIAIWDEMIEFN